MLTAKDLQKLLRISRATACRMCSEGRIKAINVNPLGKVSAWRIFPEDLENFVGMKVQFNENDLPYLVSK